MNNWLECPYFNLKYLCQRDKITTRFEKLIFKNCKYNLNVTFLSCAFVSKSVWI